MFVSSLDVDVVWFCFIWEVSSPILGWSSKLAGLSGLGILLRHVFLGGFKYFLMSTPKWGNIPILTNIFSNGLQPPTSFLLFWGSELILLVLTWWRWGKTQGLGSVCPSGSWLPRWGGSCSFNDQSKDFHLGSIWWKVCGVCFMFSHRFLPLTITGTHFCDFVFVFLKLTWHWELQVIQKVSSCVIHWWDTPLLYPPSFARSRIPWFETQDKRSSQICRLPHEMRWRCTRIVEVL